MSKILYAVIGALFSILVGIATWWINGVNAHMAIVDQLQFRSVYLNGSIVEAPVTTPAPTPDVKK